MIDIKPTQLPKLKIKCVTEANKIHIAFFDELTKALRAMQGMVFT